MFAVFPAPYVAAGGAAVTSLAFHDDAYSTVADITVPAGVQAGDLMVLSDFAIDSGGPTLVTPTDFTNWININLNQGRLAVSYKIATGSETTLTGMDGDLGDDKILAVFRPDAAISTITASTPTGLATTGNPILQSITATAGTLPLIAFGFYTSFSAIDPRTFSPAATAELNSSTIHYFKYQLQNASLADASIDMDDEGSFNALAGGYLWAA
jgi:hypothetical protein